MSRNRRSRALYDEEEDDEFNEDLNEDEDDVTEEFEPDILKPEEPKSGSEEEEYDDEDDVRSHRKRSRKAVNYNEDVLLADLNEEISEDDDEEEEVKKSKRRRRALDDDDEEFDGPGNAKDDDDEFESDSSSRPRRRRNPGFIVKDDVDIDDEFEIEKENRRRGKRLRSRRGRSRTLAGDADEEIDADEDVVTLQDELKALQEDSPLNSPVQRNLRERKAINYTLPPPIMNDIQLEENQGSSVSSPRRTRNGRFGGTGGSNSSNFAANYQLRRLFPTVGPFGGGDVHALFENGGVPDGLTALGNAESSDSEDDNDLFRPTDPNDTSSKMNIITADLMGSGPNGQMKKKNTLADTDPLGIDTNIDFSAVGGLNNYIDQLKEMVTLPLLYPEIYSKFHITPPRGVLFHGPPGTGKTLMARALAASCSSQDKRITFFMRKGADCLSKWVGEAERHLRLLFEEAKQQQPSIIFFDEIDGLAPVRSSKQEQIHASIVSTLLALMDGMDNRGQVIVIGATNRPDSIDPALRRPGRFDREFYFPLPDLNSREEILKIHMRKWDNQLNEQFVKELARLTKGYGGADLRALCTESALNSIQRAYPQIYKTNDKLKININKVKVNPSDFTRALNKIIPSSARSTSLSSSPLPENIEPLLQRQLNKILNKLELVIPKDKQPSLLEESEYVDLTSSHEDGGFRHQQLLTRLNQLRVFKPRLVVSGNKGAGQGYIANALLHTLEGFNIQVLDMTKLHSDSSISPENLIIQMFQELKRHKPSVLFVPNMISFLNDITPSLKSTIASLVKNLSTNDRILIFGMIEDAENFDEGYKEELEEIFEINHECIMKITSINEEERSKFFENAWSSLRLTPLEFNDLLSRPKRKLKKLKVVKAVKPTSEPAVDPKKEIEIARNDMRLKNTLKIKLSGLMELFKVRYKRFKKPIIDDGFLIHLFDEIADPQAPYQRSGDLILEVATGKVYHNIDLEVVEERLWNGYYSEPRQFLSDVEMILKDANTSGERDRILKANEMYANAQVGIEDIEVQSPALVPQWRQVRQRERQRELSYLKKLKEEQQKQLECQENGTVLGDKSDDTADAAERELEIGQSQMQAQLDPKRETVVTEDVIPVSTNPVEILPETSKIELEKKVEEEEEGEKSAEELSDSSEDESYIQPEKQILIIDEERLENIKHSLTKHSRGKSVTELERLNSKMIELIWIHRLDLNKEDLLSDLESLVEGD